MKSIKISLILVGILILSACHNNKLEALKDLAFIEQTETNANKSSRIQISSENTIANVIVRLTDPQAEDKRFKLSMSEDALRLYNRANGTDYTLLPSGNYEIASNEVVVKAGGVFSNPLECVIKPLSQELLNSGNKYAIAFRLESNSDIGVLNGGDVFVYVLQPVIETNVPVLGTYRSVYRKAIAKTTPVDLPNWTIEMRVNMSGFQKNNQALFGTWGAGGSEIYMRFGDEPIPNNTLNVKFGGPQIDKSKTEFEPNKWYHIALVYDGVKAILYVNGQKDTETDKPAGRTFNIGDEVHIAGSGSEYFIDGVMMSEVRIWNTARTEKQINENQYLVSSNAPGLLHYWKMNEGQGNELKNSVVNAPSLFIRDSRSELVSNPIWRDNVRSDDKGAETDRGRKSID